MRPWNLACLLAAAIALAAPSPSLGEGKAPPQEKKLLFYRIDEEGRVFRLSREVFESGDRKAVASGGSPASWDEVVKTVFATCREAESVTLPAPGKEDDRAATLELRWEAKRRRCNVYAAYNMVGSNAGGLNKALRKLKRLVQKEGRALRLRIEEEVTAKWVYEALKKVQSLEPRRMRIRPLSDLEVDTMVSDRLRDYPLGMFRWDMVNAVEIRVVVDKEAPYYAIASFLSLCARVRLSGVRLGLSPRKMLAPIEHHQVMGMHGGDWNVKDLQTAILSGLKWLARHQNRDGLWSCTGYHRHCKGEKCAGPGSTADYDLGITGLGILAFLGAGHTHRQGDYRKTVQSGLDAIRKAQGPDGWFRKADNRHEDGAWIYGHCICTKALCEAVGWDRKNGTLREAARKGTEFLLRCQNPGLGWRYGIATGKNDSSCTAWAVSALLSARRAGLTVPDAAFTGALSWFDRVTDETYRKTGYTTRGDSGARLANARSYEPGEAMTAAATFARISILGRARGGGDINAKAGELLLGNMPTWKNESLDFYYWYWGTKTTFLLGDKFWTSWSARLLNALLPNQKTEGCAAGSWDAIGAWAEAGGRVYTTAIIVQALEVFFR